MARFIAGSIALKLFVVGGWAWSVGDYDLARWDMFWGSIFCLLVLGDGQ